MKMLALILALGVAAPLAFTACDRTVSEKSSSTETPSGNTVEKKTVVEHPNGTVTEEKEKTVTNNNP